MSQSPGRSMLVFALLLASCTRALAADAGTPPPADAQAVTIGGHAARASASSTLASKDGRYSVVNLFDGKPETAWVEGAPGRGEGEKVTLEFDKPVTIHGFAFLPGYAKSIKSLTENVVPYGVKLTVDGSALETLGFDYVEIPKSPQKGICALAADAANLAWQLVVFREPMTGRRFEAEFIPGPLAAKYDDLAVSEWVPLLAGNGAPLDDALMLPSEVKALASILVRVGEKQDIPDDAWEAETFLYPLTVPDTSHLSKPEASLEGVADKVREYGLGNVKNKREDVSRLTNMIMLNKMVTVVKDSKGIVHATGPCLFCEDIRAPERLSYHLVLRLGGDNLIREAGPMIVASDRCAQGKCTGICAGRPNPFGEF